MKASCMTENEIGKTILDVVSACRRLADAPTGILSVGDKNFCSLIAHKFTTMFNDKLVESRTNYIMNSFIPPHEKPEVLTPIVPKFSP